MLYRFMCGKTTFLILKLPASCKTEQVQLQHIADTK